MAEEIATMKTDEYTQGRWNALQSLLWWVGEGCPDRLDIKEEIVRRIDELMAESPSAYIETFSTENRVTLGQNGVT
jgi:hypothetical protein